MYAKEVFFHFGGHRTASTALQRFMRKASKGVPGLVYVGPEEMRSSAKWPRLRGLERLARGRMKESAVEDLIADIVDEIAEIEADRLVLANENIAGPMLGISRGIYPFADRVSRLIQALKAQGTRVRGLLVIREQGTLLQSSYTFRVSVGELWSPEEFLGRLDPKLLSWLSVARELRRALGHELTILPYELLVSDFAAFRAELRAVHDIFQSFEELASVNVSLKPLPVFVVQQLLAYGVDLQAIGAKKMATQLDKAFAQLGPQGAVDERSLEDAAIDFVAPYVGAAKDGWVGTVRHAVRVFRASEARGCHVLRLSETSTELVRSYTRPANTEFLRGYVRPQWHALWATP